MSVPSRTLCLTQGNSLVLHCASLLRTIFASSARAHELMHVQIVRDFPQTKLDNGINSPFLLNELGDPRFFFQVFARNSLMKNIFEEEKKFDSRTQFFFLENGSQLGVFWPRRGPQVNQETVRKSAILPQPGNQERLKWSNTAYVNKWSFTFRDKTLCLSSNQDLILYEGDSNF